MTGREMKLLEVFAGFWSVVVISGVIFGILNSKHLLLGFMNGISAIDFSTEAKGKKDWK